MEDTNAAERAQVSFVDEKFSEDIRPEHKENIKAAIMKKIDQILFCHMLMEMNAFILFVEFDPGAELGPYLFRLYQGEPDHVQVIRIDPKAPNIVTEIGDIYIRVTMSIE